MLLQPPTTLKVEQSSSNEMAIQFNWSSFGLLTKSNPPGVNAVMRTACTPLFNSLGPCAKLDRTEKSSSACISKFERKCLVTYVRGWVCEKNSTGGFCQGARSSSCSGVGSQLAVQNCKRVGVGHGRAGRVVFSPTRSHCCLVPLHFVLWYIFHWREASQNVPRSSSSEQVKNVQHQGQDSLHFYKPHTELCYGENCIADWVVRLQTFCFWKWWVARWHPRWSHSWNRRRRRQVIPLPESHYMFQFKEARHKYIWSSDTIILQL